MKENELQYLKKEVQCLRDELQMLQKVGPDWGPLGREPLDPPVGACSVPGTLLASSCHGSPRASPEDKVSLSLFGDRETG